MERLKSVSYLLAIEIFVFFFHFHIKVDSTKERKYFGIASGKSYAIRSQVFQNELTGAWSSTMGKSTNQVFVFSTM